MDKLDDIKIPNNIRSVTKETIRKGRVIKGKANNKRYKNIIVASLLVVSVSTITLKSETIWALVNNLGKNIEYFMGAEKEEYEEYKINLNQSASDKGITLSLHDAMLDDTGFKISTTIDKSKFDDTEFKDITHKDIQLYFTDAQVYMDGNRFVNIGGGSTSEEGIESSNKSFMERLLGKGLNKDIKNSLLNVELQRIDNDEDGLPEIDDYEILDNIDPNKDYNVKIVFNELGVEKRGIIPFITKTKFDTIDGKWEFNFKVNGKTIMGQTKIYDINKRIDINQDGISGNIIIESIRVSPVSARIKYSTSLNLDKNNKDNISFNVDLLDQDGNMINIGGGASSDDSVNYKYEMSGTIEDFESLKSVDILPYIYIIPEGKGEKDYKRIELKGDIIKVNIQKQP